MQVLVGDAHQGRAPRSSRNPVFESVGPERSSRPARCRARRCMQAADGAARRSMASRQHASVHSTRPSSRPGTERAPRQALSARQGNTRAPPGNSQACRQHARPSERPGRRLARRQLARAQATSSLRSAARNRGRAATSPLASRRLARLRTASTASRSIRASRLCLVKNQARGRPALPRPPPASPWLGALCVLRHPPPAVGPLCQQLLAGDSERELSVRRGDLSRSHGESARPCPAAASPAETRGLALPLAACCLLCAN